MSLEQMPPNEQIKLSKATTPKLTTMGAKRRNPISRIYFKMCTKNSRILFMEPPPGLEPGTFSLQKSCSTAELRWQKNQPVLRFREAS